MTLITFNRQNLYNDVWSKPMNELAKIYGINVYQLTKVCDKLEIPRPESGYWSKLRYGKKVKQKPLGNSDIKEYTLKLDIVSPGSLNKILPKGYKPIVVKDQLRNPHPLVNHTYKYLKERSKERSPGDKYGRLNPYHSGYLSVSVSKSSLKRAMRIYDAILKASIRQGFEVGTATKYDRNNTYIQIDKEKVHIFIMEEGKQIKTKIENPRYSWEEYDYERYTTGKLKLSISSSYYGFTNRSISDTKAQSLEERLDKFFPILLEIFEEEKRGRIKYEERKSQEEIARKIREQEEREYRAEMKRRETLEQQSEKFTKSKYIYQFIREFEARVKQNNLDQEQLVRFTEWKKWATEHADRLNPVKQTIESILNPVEEEEESMSFLW